MTTRTSYSVRTTCKFTFSLHIVQPPRYVCMWSTATNREMQRTRVEHIRTCSITTAVAVDGDNLLDRYPFAVPLRLCSSVEVAPPPLSIYVRARRIIEYFPSFKSSRIVAGLEPATRLAIQNVKLSQKRLHISSKNSNYMHTLNTDHTREETAYSTA